MALRESRSRGGLNGTCKLQAAATTLEQHPLDTLTLLVCTHTRQYG